MEKAVPFVAPKVEQATPKGTIHAKDPKTRDPKVIATAFEFSISDPVMTGQSGYIIRILYPGYIFILCDYMYINWFDSPIVKYEMFTRR